MLFGPRDGQCIFDPSRPSRIRKGKDGKYYVYQKYGFGWNKVSLFKDIESEEDIKRVLMEINTDTDHYLNSPKLCKQPKN